jgi:hypothetical protein
VKPLSCSLSATTTILWAGISRKAQSVEFDHSHRLSLICGLYLPAWGGCVAWGSFFAWLEWGLSEVRCLVLRSRNFGIRKPESKSCLCYPPTAQSLNSFSVKGESVPSTANILEGLNKFKHVKYLAYFLSHCSCCYFINNLCKMLVTKNVTVPSIPLPNLVYLHSNLMFRRFSGRSWRATFSHSSSCLANFRITWVKLKREARHFKCLVCSSALSKGP